MRDVLRSIKVFVREKRRAHRRFVRKLSRRDRKLYEAFVFLLKFTCVALPMHIVIWMNVDMAPLQEITAEMVTTLLNLLGFNAVHNGISIYMDGIRIEIIRDCTGWKSFMAVCGLVIATPKASWRDRITAILAGALVIAAVNLIRLVTTILVGVAYGIKVMEVVHIHLWRWGLTGAIVLYWYFWYRKVVLKKRKWG